MYSEWYKAPNHGRCKRKATLFKVSLQDMTSTGRKVTV